MNICPEAKLQRLRAHGCLGRARRNLALSKRRARAVAGYMIHKGIDAGRLVAIGYGDKRPVAPNDTRANMARNRRIEVAITARRRRCLRCQYESRGRSMDYLVANLAWYMAGAFAAGFVVAWIACAKVEG